MSAYILTYDAELTTVEEDTNVFVIAIPVQTNLAPGSRYYGIALRTTSAEDAYYCAPSDTADASLAATTAKVPGADNDKIVTVPAYDATVQRRNPRLFSAAVATVRVSIYAQVV